MIVRKIKFNSFKFCAYLNSVGELPIVLVLEVVESDGVGVLLGEMAAFESLLQIGDAVAGAGQVGGKHDDDESLDGAIVKRLGHLVPEEYHQHVLLVVARVVGVAL